MIFRLRVGEERTGMRRGYVASVIGSIVRIQEAIVTLTILDAMNLAIGAPWFIALLIQSTTETDISIPTVGDCQEGGDRFTKICVCVLCIPGLVFEHISMIIKHL